MFSFAYRNTFRSFWLIGGVLLQITETKKLSNGITLDLEEGKSTGDIVFFKFNV